MASRASVSRSSPGWRVTVSMPPRPRLLRELGVGLAAPGTRIEDQHRPRGGADVDPRGSLYAQCGAVGAERDPRQPRGDGHQDDDDDDADDAVPSGQTHDRDDHRSDHDHAREQARQSRAGEHVPDGHGRDEHEDQGPEQGGPAARQHDDGHDDGRGTGQQRARGAEPSHAHAHALVTSRRLSSSRIIPRRRWGGPPGSGRGRCRGHRRAGDPRGGHSR